MPRLNLQTHCSTDRLRTNGCVLSILLGMLGLAVVLGLEVPGLPKRCPISGIPLGMDLLLVAAGLLVLAVLWPKAYWPLCVLGSVVGWAFRSVRRSGPGPEDRGEQR